MSDNVSKLKKYMREISSYAMLVIGAVIAAFSIEEFLVPCTILDGGIVGISIMINNLSGIPLGILTLALNIPFLLMGMRKLGAKFIVKSAVAMVTFSSFLEVFASLVDVTHEYLLAVCFGGVFLGVGVGFVIRAGGCLDGTETVAIFLNKKFNLPVGQSVLFFNIVIYTVAGFLFGFDRAMYSLLTYFITSKVIDFVE
ncbi:MAG: YitT family protein, partial [Acetatifactor sp.]|nr:YitT family protein [Acetatifactor sp.]